MNNKVEMDCCIVTEDKWFRYRAAAVIIEDGCVLLASNEIDDYYYSVGGGVHIGEAAEDAVVREVHEETGIKYEVDRLAFIHENFFKGSGSIGELECHEITFYYLMRPKGNKELNSDSYSQGGKEFMNWIPISKLSEYKAYPTFFKEKLIDMKEQVEHIVTREY